MIQNNNLCSCLTPNGYIEEKHCRVCGGFSLFYVRHIEECNQSLRKELEEVRDFAIWMTGCGYDFCQHEYFCKQRDKLLKGAA
jgi:hypothetical protein